MRRYMRLGLGMVSARGPDDVAGSVKSRAQGVAEQISTLAAGLLEWTAEARASLLHELREIVARQVEEMGVATNKDLDDLRARLDRLEAAMSAPTKARAKRGAGATRAKSGSASSKRAGSGRRRASRGSG